MKELNQKRAQQKDNRDAGSSPVLKDSERPGSQESDKDLEVEIILLNIR